MDRYNINLLDNGNLNYYGNLIKKEDIEAKIYNYYLQEMKELQEINKVPINKNCKYADDRMKYLLMGYGAIVTNPLTAEKIRMCNWDGCNSCPMHKSIIRQKTQFNRGQDTNFSYFWFEQIKKTNPQQILRSLMTNKGKTTPKCSCWMKKNGINNITGACSNSVRVWATVRGFIDDPENITEDELKKVVADNGFICRDYC